MDTIPLIDLPLLEIKVDIDSLYFGAPDLATLVGMTGENCMYNFESVRKHIRSSAGSRFSIECGDLANYPISSRGFHPKKIPFHRLPNVVICNCFLTEALGHKMTIYLSFTGVERLRKTNYFYRDEMAVINTALNLTVSHMKDKALTDDTIKIFADQIGRLTSFEQQVVGDFGKVIENRTSSLGPKAMKVFAQLFDRALTSINCEDGIDLCLDPKFNGMRFDKGKCLLKRAYISKALDALNKGHYFTANLAGIKNVFKERTEFTLTMDEAYYSGSSDDNLFYPGMTTNGRIQSFVDLCVNTLYTQLKTKIVEVLPEKQDIYFFDIGVELSSLDSNLDFVSLTNPAFENLQRILEEP
jgi:hypothetical protein